MKTLNLILLSFILVIKYIFSAEDYYKILGVPRNATEEQIRKAFKKLSIKYHPDKNKDKKEWAKTQFVKIANAYEVLTDTEKRRAYDLGGEDGVKQQDARSQQQGGGFNFDGDFSDVFSQFFGGRGGGFRQQRGGRQQQHQEEEREIEFFDNTDVLKLTIQSLTKILNRNENWFVLFYKSKDQNIKETVEMWKTLAEKTYGIFKIGSCNCKTDDELCDEFMIRETPEIVFFPEIGDEEEKYKGIKSWEKIFQFGAGRMQSFVRTVNDQNYGDFITSNPANHKVLLFTSKKVTPPLLKAISKKYQGKLYFGEVRQSEKELVQIFKVDKFPTLKVISDGENHDGVNYEGPMSRDSIEKFLNKYAYETIKVDKKAASVIELNEKVYNSNTCNNNDAKNICFIFIVKSPKADVDSSDRLILNQLSDRYKNDPFKFFYLLEKDYGHIRSSFQGADKEASIVILKGKRKRYLAINVQDAEDWTHAAENEIDKILSGTGNFKNMMKKISFAKVLQDDL